MPLRDIDALDEWARRENPPYATWRNVNEWVQSLADAPWRAPSVPFPELSDPPIYEYRTAVVPGTDGVEIIFQRYFDGEIVDLIWVGQFP